MSKNKNLAFTQLEKFIKNNFVVKVNIASKKLLNFKKKNLGVFLTGFTLVEILIVFAIIGIVSVFYIVDSRPNTAELLKMDTTRLAADIRYVRSMATSRVTYDGAFPSGGYGIIFQNVTAPNKGWYKLYVGSTNNVIKTVYLSNAAFKLVDPNSKLSRASAINDTAQKRLTFTSENSLVTSGFEASTDGDYQVEIYYGINPEPLYYSKSIINIGRQTEDNFVWSNLAITYDTRGAKCGNGIVEGQEECERFDVDGDLLNADCFPKDFMIGVVNMGCKFNSCGDGVLAGAEQCERNILATEGAVPKYKNICEYAVHYDWCYICSSLESAEGKCKNMDGDIINCCKDATPSTGRCVDCQWSNVSTCPLDIPSDSFCPAAP